MKRSCSIYLVRHDAAVEIDPELVARTLKTPPSRNIKPGGWHFDSADHVTSEDLSDHFHFITDFAQHNRSGLLSLAERGARFRIRIFWEFDDDILSASLDMARIGRLAGLIEAIDLSII